MFCLKWILNKKEEKNKYDDGFTLVWAKNFWDWDQILFWLVIV